MTRRTPEELAAIAEDAEFLVGHGATWDTVTARLSADRGAITHALEVAGRRDVVDRLIAVSTSERWSA